MPTHGPIADEYRDKMTELAGKLDVLFNGPKRGFERTVGFCLLVFPFGEEPLSNRINYISNADRRDMITAMKELIARFEGRHSEEQPGPGVGHA